MAFRVKHKVLCRSNQHEEMPTNSRNSRAKPMRHATEYKKQKFATSRKKRAFTNLWALNSIDSMNSAVVNKNSTIPELPSIKLNSALFEYKAASSGESEENQMHMHIDVFRQVLLGPIQDNKRKMIQSQFVDMMYKRLFILEEQNPIIRNNLQHHKNVTPRQRATIMNWLCLTHMSLRLTQETLQMSMRIIDRYLQANQNIKISKLQLLALTSLFIAVKYEEVVPPPITKFICIPYCNFNIKTILAMERKIFMALNYNLAHPVPIHFLRRFSRCIIATNREHTMAKYLVELTVANYGLSSYKPSKIAAAALFLSFHYCNEEPNETCGLLQIYWPPILQKISTYTTEQLHMLTRRIAVVAIKQRNSEFKAIYEKYLTDKYSRVSETPSLYSRLAQSIIDCVKIDSSTPMEQYFPKI